MHAYIICMCIRFKIKHVRSYNGTFICFQDCFAMNSNYCTLLWGSHHSAPRFTSCFFIVKFQKFFYYILYDCYRHWNCYLKSHINKTRLKFNRSSYKMSSSLLRNPSSLHSIIVTEMYMNITEEVSKKYQIPNMGV